MPAALELACPNCRRPHEERTLVCDLCGHLLRRAPPDPAAERGEPSTGSWSPSERASPVRAEAPGTRLEPWLFLGLGLVTAPLLAWTPILQYMGWFLAALVHEMGHAAFAWLCGMPAVPAISLGGHAAAVHAPQSLLLALAIAVVLGLSLARVLVGRPRTVALALLALFYPVLAFTGVADVLHLLAGHGAELLFATLCLWKALDGGFTRTRLERALYGMLGWNLLGKNVALCWGLLRSVTARSEYRSSGSFGLTNDYLRVAELLALRLPTVALGMLLAGLLVLPAAIALWQVSTRARAASEACDVDQARRLARPPR